MLVILAHLPDSLLFSGKVAYFSARNSQSLEPSGLTFNGVVTKSGNEFNSTSGVFVAPYDGVYFFTLTLAVTTESYASCYIVKNRFRNLAESFSSIVGGFCSAASSTVVHLVAGDHISVDNCHGNGTYNAFKTSFSGFLLKAD